MGYSVEEAPLVFALIFANVIISLYALFMDRSLMEDSIFNVKAVLQKKQFHRMVTSSFLHGSPMHLAFNMLSLYFLGPAVEYRLGTLNFFLLYFGSELCATGFTLWRRQKEPAYSSLGASGAVSGVVLAYCTFAPFSMLYILGIVPIPAIGFAVGYIAYSVLVMGKDSKIAHEAHLGGAIGGALITITMVGWPF